jgi:hypothetical protein
MALLSCLVSAVLAAATPASSSPTASAAEVEALIAEGNELRRAGNDGKAFSRFKRAYDLARTPRTAAQLGLVELQLGYHLDADRHLREALAAAGDFWVAKNRENLQTALAHLASNLGQLVITGGPDGAEVRVNGAVVGTLPLPEPVRVPKGSVVIEVSAGGRVRHQSFDVPGGRSLSVYLDLGELPAAPTRPRPAASSATSPSVGGHRSAEPTIHAAAPRRSLRRDRFGAFVRLDAAVWPEAGQRFAPGLSYGVGDHVELAAAALLGKTASGAWLGARWLLGDAVVKPALQAGVPIFFGARAEGLGAQAGAGLTVDVGARASLFADLSAVWFPAASGDAAAWLVPGLGLQVRL